MINMVIALLFLLPGCQWWSSRSTVHGSGVLQSQERAILSFDHLAVAGIGTVIFTQGDEYKCVIEAEDTIMPYIQAEVDRCTLQIRLKEGMDITPTMPIIYYVTAPHLKEVALMGAVGFHTQSLQGESLQLLLSGASEVVAYLDVQSLEVEAAGNINAMVHGVTDIQKIALSGAGAYDAGACQSREVIVDASGSATITVSAEEKLVAKISGSVVLQYKGEPRLTIRQSGAAIVNSVR